MPGTRQGQRRSTLIGAFILFSVISGSIAWADLCEEQLVGNIWKAHKVVPGKFGGEMVLAMPTANKDEISHAREFDFRIFARAVGQNVARFFGHGMSGGFAVFPSRTEANGRRDFFNSLIENDAKHPAYLAYSFAEVVDQPANEQAEVALRKYRNERTWFHADNGNLFFHDSNAHSGLNWIPRVYTGHVDSQIDVLFAYIEWMKQKYPELLQKKFSTAIPAEDGQSYEESDLPLEQHLYWEYLKRIDFGNANIFIRDFTQVGLDSSLLYTELPVARADHFRDVTEALNEYTFDFNTPEETLRETVPDEDHSVDSSIQEFFEVTEISPSVLGSRPSRFYADIWREFSVRFEVIEAVVNSVSTPSELDGSPVISLD